MRISPFMATVFSTGTVLLLQGCEQPNDDSADEPAVEQIQAVQAPAGATTDQSSMVGILAGEHRSPEHKARDKYRHPAETLGFFGLRPGSTVVEIWPGGGWYTEIIAPYVREQGRFIAAGFDPESEIEFIRVAAGRYREKLDEYPELYGQAETAVLMPPDKLDFVAPESVDLILTFRSIHNWMPRDSADMMIAAMYQALKPGGVLGVVEHRGIPSIPQDPQAKTGYVNQEYAIDLIEKAGFVLNGSSEINANSADIKDYPEGVWTLPPTLRLKAQGRETYRAIGESDRFTLKFVKPAE
jgi:predicted methyltransferase